MTDSYFIKLQNRGLIQIEGQDRTNFLQALVTNDVVQAKDGKSVYACLLTPQGKFLHDFFVLAGDGVLLLECEGGARAQDLYKRLNRYRLRSDIQLSVEDHIDVYAVFGTETGYCDPRHKDMGWRDFEKPQELQEKSFDVWDEHRIRLGIPDGSRDMVMERSTLIEGNIDKLHGVSFEKGCYVGQEIVSRMYHRGLAKKHLYSVSARGPIPAPGTEIHINGKSVGEMRSACGTVGLALLKDEAVDEMQSGPIQVL